MPDIRKKIQTIVSLIRILVIEPKPTLMTVPIILISSCYSKVSLKSHLKTHTRKTANTHPFSLVLSSPLQCPSGSSCGQFQSSSNESTGGRRGGHTQGLCQDRFMVRLSSSCCLKGAGCQCLLLPQPWNSVGLFLYFPSACLTSLRVPHSHSAPRGDESHSPPQQLGCPAPLRPTRTSLGTTGFLLMMAKSYLQAMHADPTLPSCS